jgi:autotransporter-associated beta strand protein
MVYTGTASSSSNRTWSGVNSNTIENNSATGVLTLSGNYAQSIANGTFTLRGSNTGANTFAGNISAAASGAGSLLSLTKDGAGTWILSGNNTYTGITTVSGGILQFAKTASLYNATTASWTASNITVNSGATLALNVGGVGEFSAGNVTSRLTGLGGLGGAVNNNGLRSGSNIGFDTTNAGSSFAISDVIANSTGTGGGAIGVTKLGTGTLVLSGNNTYTGATTINAGTLEIASTGRLGGGSYSGNINNNGTLTFNGSSTQTLSGIISGSGGLTKNNTASTLTLTGTNTFTGGILINAGRVDSNSGSLGTGNVTIASGALIGLTSSGTYSNNFTIAGAGTGSGVIQAPFSTGNFTISGLTTLTGDATVGSRGQASASGSNLIFAGGITTGGANRTLTLSVLASPTIINNAITFSTNSVSLGTGGTLDIGAGISTGGTGTVNLNVGGNTWGTLIVKAANSNSSNATLNLGAANALGGSGAVLQLGSTTTALENITVNLNGNNQTIGGLRSFGSTGSASANGTRTITSATAATITIDNSSATNYLYDGVFSGGISLVKNGTSTQTLSGNNTYTGATTVNAGTLLLSGNGALGTSTISISGGTLDMGGKSLTNTFGSLTGGTLSNGTLSNNGGNYNLQNGTVSAVLAGTNGVNKTGSGTVTLSGANTYTGTTTISSGTLRAAATGALANTSSIDVNGGSLLVAVANAVNSNANINLGGGTLAVSGNFNQNVGLLTLSADSVIDLNGFSGILRFGGVGSWASSANLAIWNWNGINQYNTPVGDGVNNRRVVFTNNSGLDSYLDRISFYSGNGTGFAGNAFEQGFSGGGTEIIAVPEPETYITGVLLLLGFTIYQLRLARQGQGLLSRLTFLRQKKS